MWTGNFNIHFGFIRFGAEGLFAVGLRVAFSFFFFVLFVVLRCFGLICLAVLFLFEGFLVACIRTDIRCSISESIKLARCLANVCSVI